MNYDEESLEVENLSESEELQDEVNEDAVHSDGGEDESAKDFASYQEILEELKEQKRAAKDIIAVLEPLTSNTKIHEEIANLAQNIQDSYRTIKSSKSANTAAQNALNKHREQIKVDLDGIGSQLQKTNQYLKHIKALEEKARIKKEGIDTLKQAANASKQEITEIKSEVNRLLKAVENLSKKASAWISKMSQSKSSADSILKGLQEINNQALKHSKELHQYYIDGKKSFDKIEQLDKRVEASYRRAKKSTVEIVGWYEKVFAPKGIKKEIEETEKTIKAQQLRIDQQLGLAASNRLCGSLEVKVENLQKSLSGWKLATFSLAITLVILNAIIGLGWIDISNGWRHFSVISPLIFLLIFSSFEYARAARYYQEYSFKFIAAFAMPAYFELLEERNEHEALKYIVETTKSIYTNPSDKVKKHSVLDYIFEVVKKVLPTKSLDTNEIMESMVKNGLEELAGAYLEQQDKRKLIRDKGTLKEDAELKVKAVS